MHTEMQDITIRAPRPTHPSELVEDDQLWDTLTSSQISLPLHKLLRLIPWFRDTLASLTSDTKSTALLVNLAEPGTGPPLMDSQNSTVKIIIKGHDLHGCIIDGGLRCQCNQRGHMPGARFHPLGTMPLLALDGRYSIGSPNRVNPPPRFYAKGAYVHNLGSSFTPRSL